MPLSENDCAATYKVLIVGDAYVGKTALLRCLMGYEFAPQSRPTVGKTMKHFISKNYMKLTCADVHDIILNLRILIFYEQPWTLLQSRLKWMEP